MLLFWSALIVDGRVVRLGRWESGGSEGGRFLVLFKGGGRRVSPKYHIFVFDINQGNKETGWNYHWNCMFYFGGL